MTRLTLLSLLFISSAMSKASASFESTYNAKRFEEYSDQYVRGEKAPSLDGVIFGLKVATDAMKNLHKNASIVMSEEDHFAAFDILRAAIEVLRFEKQRRTEFSDVIVAYSAELALLDPESNAVGLILESACDYPALGILQSVKNLKDEKAKELLLKMMKVSREAFKYGNG